LRSEARQNSFFLFLGAALRASSRRASSLAFSADALEVQGTLAFDRIKTVSKRGPFERWDLPLSEEQTPHSVEKPKNRRYGMEPKEASCGLHTQEVAGSSPAAPTIQISHLQPHCMA